MLSGTKHLSSGRTQMLRSAQHDRRDRPGSKNLPVKDTREGRRYWLMPVVKSNIDNHNRQADQSQTNQPTKQRQTSAA